MKKFSHTTILLGTAIACAVVAGGLYTFFFISMKNKTEAALELSAELDAFSNTQTHYISTLSSLEMGRSDIDHLSSYLIKENQIVDFTKKIEALGPRAGVELTLQSLDPATTKAGDSSLGFRVTAEGRFENVQRFLVLMQNFPGKFDWRTVKFNRSSEVLSADGKPLPKTSAPLWKAEVALTAYNFIR